MSILTKPSIRGFVAKAPQELEAKNGDPYVKVRFGQDRKHREPDGTFTDLGKTYDTMVAYDDNVQRIIDNFVPGDRFVAQGHIRTFSKGDDGPESEVFVVTGIGHDSAYTRYDVDRSARRAPVEQTPERAASQQAPAFESPERSGQSTSAPALGL